MCFESTPLESFGVEILRSAFDPPLKKTPLLAFISAEPIARGTNSRPGIWNYHTRNTVASHPVAGEKAEKLQIW